MKLNKTFAILFAAVMILPVTSCLKEESDVFITPSSQRMQNYLENVRKILQKPTNGWALSYYPGSSSATCYMAVKFGAQQVTAFSQDAPNQAVTSSYKLATDDGAVLSFDTYNSVLHYYATASADHYQARGGDFEFDIISVSAERIVLRGKRSRNLCYLDPLSTDATSFLTEMVAAKNALSIVAFSGEVTGGLVDGFLDGTSNTLSIGRRGAEASEMVSARYMIVPGGIHINEPFTFQGVTFQDFEYNEDPDDASKGTFTGSGITFDKVIPEGYVPYNQFLGKWTLDWYTDHRTFDVELVALEDGTSFKMKGLSTFFEPVIGYNSARGQLTWNAQAIGSAGGNTIMLTAWDLTHGGYLNWDDYLGFIGIAEDNTVQKLVVNWTDNGLGDGFVVDSWLIWSVTADGDSAGGYDAWSFANGSYQLPYLNSMTKIVE